MCGIVGFNFKNQNLLENMKDAIKHRGPDDNGSFYDNNISLGHVRLSILDLSDAGHQPMQFENLVMVYNGEVYNFEEIKQELIKYGYTFGSNSDSEVILKAYHKWGIKAVDKFRGMFSIAIFDKEKNKIILIRDRVGVKPLYYYFNGDKFIFASELRAIKEYKKFDIDTISLSYFFEYGYIGEDKSIFKGVKKLLPAHYLEFNIKNKSLKISKYWDIQNYFSISKKDENEIIDELEKILIDSIKYRMKSDVSVGVFLSGGIDSSLVASVLQKHYGDIHTFTIGFKEKKYDESGFAKKVAQHIGSKHIEYILDINKTKNILEKFVDIYDEPFGDSSAIPTYLVSQVAKQHGVKVVLSADGGDEIFCGYSRYFKSYNIIKKLQYVPLKKTLYNSIEFSKNILLKLPLSNIKPRLELLQNLLIKNSWDEVYTFLISKYQKDIQDLNLNSIKSNEYFSIDKKFHIMQKMMLWDFYNYLPNDILTKVDRATMANSIEGREPLLDNKLLEYSATIPFEYKYKNNENKYILKKVLERYLPKEMIYRRKMGFAIPMLEWFKGDLIKLFEFYFVEDDIINMNYPRKLLKDLKDGKYVNINKLWYILVYKMWKEKYY
jgi:asparagine synthase (glutamine-hydrolysing)